MNIRRCSCFIQLWMLVLVILIQYPYESNAFLLEVFGVSPLAGATISGGIVASKLSLLSRLLKGVGFGRARGRSATATDTSPSPYAIDRMFEQLRSLHYQRNLLPRLQSQTTNHHFLPPNKFYAYDLRSIDRSQSNDTISPLTAARLEAEASWDQSETNKTISILNQPSALMNSTQSSHAVSSNLAKLVSEFRSASNSSESNSKLQADLPEAFTPLINDQLYIDTNSNQIGEQKNFDSLIIINAPSNDDHFEPIRGDLDIRLDDRVVLIQNFINYKGYAHDQPIPLPQVDDPISMDQIVFGNFRVQKGDKKV